MACCYHQEIPLFLLKPTISAPSLLRVRRCTNWAILAHVPGEAVYKLFQSEPSLKRSWDSDEAKAWTIWGSNSVRSKSFFLFPIMSTRFLPPPVSYSVGTEFFPLGIEQHAFVFECLCLSIVEIKNWWIYASTPLYAFMAIYQVL
jgi:hypothetical protein